jgi:CBS domain-containing protein
LQSKGYEVHTIHPTATLGAVVDAMVDNRCGSLLVVDGKEVCGIITERDILRTVAARNGEMDRLVVRDHMTTELVTAQVDDHVQTAMGRMTDHRVRHLPVFDRGQLVGIISIGDVVKAQHDALSMENHYLRSYLGS